MSAPPPPAVLEVEYCGERHAVRPGEVFGIGREAELVVDDNPFLHRRMLELAHEGGLWWLHNRGSRLPATATADAGRVQSVLAPGARIPLIAGDTVVTFAGGPTSYELTLTVPEAERPVEAPDTAAIATTRPPGDETVGDVALTEAQKRLVLALAEPLLRHAGVGVTAIPSNAAAAARLGWPASTFNRHLDRVCEKLTRAGVPGLHAGAGRVATARRARLVEHALAARLVTPGDLPLLDAAPTAPEVARSGPRLAVRAVPVRPPAASDRPVTRSDHRSRDA